MLVVTAEMIPGVGYAEFKVLDAEWSDITGIDKQTWNYAQGGSQKLLIPLSTASLNQAVEKWGLGFQGVGFTVKSLSFSHLPHPLILTVHGFIQ